MEQSYMLLTMCPKRTHNICVRHACRLEVRLFLTFQAVIVIQTLSDGLNDCKVSLAAAFMSSPAAASHIVNVVCHYCTRFTLASRWTCCCLPLTIDCLSLLLDELTQSSTLVHASGINLVTDIKGTSSLHTGDMSPKPAMQNVTPGLSLNEHHLRPIHCQQAIAWKR